MPGPAATVGSMHVCPMLNPGTPPPPHVGGPVSQGVATVLIGGKPAATVGSMCTCAGLPDTIVMGESNVLIGGMPAATVGSTTVHGGIITVGEPTVLINTGAGLASTLAPVDRLQAPQISTFNKTIATVLGKGKKLNEAVANQEQNREEAKEHGFLGHFGFSV